MRMNRLMVTSDVIMGNQAMVKFVSKSIQNKYSKNNLMLFMSSIP